MSNYRYELLRGLLYSVRELAAGHTITVVAASTAYYKSTHNDIGRYINESYAGKALRNEQHH